MKLNNRHDILISGFYDTEFDKLHFRWMSDTSEILIINTDIVNITIDFVCNNIIPIELKIKLLDVIHVFNIPCTNSRTTIELNTLNINKILINSNYFIPCNTIPNNNDNRKLSLRMLGIYLKFENGDVKYISIDQIKTKDESEFDIFKENSILNQTNYNTKILDFTYDHINFIFNSAIFKHENKPYILTRKSKLLKFPDKFNNTLELYSLDNNYNVLNNQKLNIIDEFENEQYEDPRILNYNDYYIIGCANYVRDKVKFIHQKVLIFDKTFKHILNIHPTYDGNGKSINDNTNHQKNWTWFIYNNRLHCVYKMYPHTVVEFDWNGDVITEYKTHVNLNTYWKYGECRMGSNPILHDNMYHNFFHSSIPWKNSKRRYVMGYYTFESTPPFRITNILTQPILYGNIEDNRILSTNPLVIFPCGTIIENNNFIVSFGLNDEKTGIIEIPINNVL